MTRVDCPVCKCSWYNSPCEQEIAILKRGKCISCLVEAGETYCMDPYEFAYPGHFLWKDPTEV